MRQLRDGRVSVRRGDWVVREQIGQLIFKIIDNATWQSAVSAGRFAGAPVDIEDGFIHFSTASQVAETAAKHFHHQHDLVVVAFETASFGARLKWEPSRGGALFPHLYDTLNPVQAVWLEPMPLDDNGLPMIPECVREC